MSALRVLKINDIGNVKSILYGIGLSISILIFVGFVINVTGPFFGISKPLNLYAVIICMLIVNLLLLLLAYWQSGDRRSTSIIKEDIPINPFILLVIFLPLLAILGSVIINTDNNNILFLFMLLVIALFPLFSIGGKVPEKYFGLAILSIGLALLLHRSLISDHIWGWDIHTEYYYASQVLYSSYWDSSIYDNVNSVLSITIFTPQLSLISGLSINWVFKIVFPLIFSLVPLGVYEYAKSQTSAKVAFLGAFFFISIFTFYNELTVLPRQELAELYMILILITMVDCQLQHIQKSAIFMIFIASLVVSHYGLSYIFIAILLFSFVGTNIVKLYKKEKTKESVLNYNLILFALIFLSAWYMFNSGSSVFDTIKNIIFNIYSNIFTDFLNPETTQGLKIVSMTTISLTYQIFKYLHLVCQALISIGVIACIMGYVGHKISIEQKMMIIISFGMLLASILIPTFSASLTTTRMYHIALIILSPMIIIGLLALTKTIYVVGNIKVKERIVYRSLCVFLMIFILFNTGIINQIINDNPNSISLNTSLDYPKYEQAEVLGAQWMFNHSTNNRVYGDPFGAQLLKEYFYPQWSIKIFTGDTTQVSNNSLLFLRELNVDGYIQVPADQPTFERPYSYIDIHNSRFGLLILDNKSEVYCNGKSEVWV